MQPPSIYSSLQPHQKYTKQWIRGKSKQTHLTGAKCRKLCLTKSQLAFILQLIGSVSGVWFSNKSEGSKGKLKQFWIAWLYLVKKHSKDYNSYCNIIFPKDIKNSTQHIAPHIHIIESSLPAINYPTMRQLTKQLGNNN